MLALLSLFLDKDLEKMEKKKAMMENMAQLWLQQEVHDLEGKGSNSKGTFRGFAHYSPYIVVDHFALTAHFNLVKEVVASKKFAVIIPTAGKEMLILFSGISTINLCFFFSDSRTR